MKEASLTQNNADFTNTNFKSLKYPKPFRVRTTSMAGSRQRMRHISHVPVSEDFIPGSRIIRKSKDNTSQIKRLKVPLKEFLLVDNSISIQKPVRSRTDKINSSIKRKFNKKCRTAYGHNISKFMHRTRNKF